MNLSENFKKLMRFPSKEEVLKAADKNKATEFGDVAADMALSLTPVGGVAGMVKKATPKIMQVADDFFGMHKSTELGDIVLTKSAKGPGFQLTMFDGKLGSSNTVKDMQFATKEEAIKAFDDMHMGGGISDVKDEVIGRKGFDKSDKTKPAFLKIDPEESVSPKVDKMDVLLNRLTEALEKSNKPKKIIRDKDGKIVGVE